MMAPQMILRYIQVLANRCYLATRLKSPHHASSSCNYLETYNKQEPQSGAFALAIRLKDSRITVINF